MNKQHVISTWVSVVSEYVNLGVLAVPSESGEPWNSQPTVYSIYDEVPCDQAERVVRVVCKLASGPAAKRQEWQLMFPLCRALGRLQLDAGLGLELVNPQNYAKALEMFREAVTALGFVGPDSQVADWTNPVEVFDHFMDRWAAMKSVEGQDAFQTADETARKAPISLLGDRSHSNLGGGSKDLFDQVSHLASVAYHLQIFNGDDPIFLPVEKVGAMFGKSKANARQFGARQVNRLNRYGLLTLLTKAVPNKRAAEYKFNADRLDLYEPPTSS